MLPRRLLLLSLVLALLILAGTLGYALIEGWSLFDALYMTVITLTTVGYEEVHPLSDAGRTFTMLLLLGGVFSFIYAATELIRTVVSGELQTTLGRQRMARDLAKLKDHMIICGFGRMGRLVCQVFCEHGCPFVVIDRDPAVLAGFDLAHGLAVPGDATSDALLQQAGVAHARALVTVVPSDADNLYITMSARLLNDRLTIVARAENEVAEKKLMRAGASRVVSPYVIGGHRVANAVLRPNVVDFVELATRTEHLELQLEESKIGAASCLVGSTLQQSRLRQEQGVIIVAIKKAAGRMLFNPPADAVMQSGDILITLGPRDKLDQLDTLARG
ncbi:MAG TPA: potassium channel protein [Gemmataceae bacterium]|nr:potassium channel protein [Gemmataceae bacterium]